MPPRRIGRMLTSMEIAEFHGYERAFGPIDGSWDRETLAQIHELLQTIAYIDGAQAEENPVPRPGPKDRPGSAYGFTRDEHGLWSVPPEEEPEEVSEVQNDGGWEALDAYLESGEG